MAAFKTKSTALFLIAFVCLNAGGAFCAAYCRSAFTAIAAHHSHASLKPILHCDAETANPRNDSSVVRNGKVKGCAMSIGLIAAPIEKKVSSSEVAAAPETVKTQTLYRVAFANTVQTFIPAYRGPPLDRRVDRIKQGLIRI